MLESNDDIRSIKLKALSGLGNPVYEVTQRSQTKLFDAVTGERLSPLSRDAIASLARGYYTGGGEITSILQLESVPVEVRGRPVSMWRVDFDDRWSTSFYLDPDDGALLTRRHRWWRWFDSFWMLHVMDYGYERDDVNNSLLRITSGLTLVLGLTGIVLLFYSFRWLRRVRPA